MHPATEQEGRTPMNSHPQLNIDRNQKLSITVKDLIGARIAVLGASGYGKTNTAAVLIEELRESGQPMTIVDPENDYYTLREKYPFIILGSGPHADLPITPAQAPALAAFVLENNLSVILDVSETPPGEAQEMLHAYFARLWELNTRTRQPHIVVLEEAHEFIRQGDKSPLHTLMTTFALRGRKRGFTMIVVSQRAPMIEKSVLTQAGTLFLHRVIYPTDMKIYRDILPIPASEANSMVAALGTGQAIVRTDAGLNTVHIRERHTSHPGATPTDLSAAPAPIAIDHAIIEALRTALGGNAPVSEAPVKPTKPRPTTHTPESLVAMLQDVQAMKANPDVGVYITQRDAIRAELTNARNTIALLLLLYRTPCPDAKPEQSDRIIPQAVAPITPDMDVNRARTLQQKHFEKNVLNRVRSMSRPWTRRALHAVIHDAETVRSRGARHDGLSSRMIAIAEGLSESTVELRRLRPFEDAGLITIYSDHVVSKARELLSERYPALRTDDLIDQLLKACL
jgi:uncharacterized protein